MKLILGFLLAFGIGAVCRIARIPSPAPNAILGALLVVAMSTGYVVTEKCLNRRSSQPVSYLPRSHDSPVR
jgi:XapX domain-containing protein